MTKSAFIDLVRKELGLKNPAYAELAAEAVLKTLHARLTEGQADHIEAHLPKELRSMWSRGLTDKLLAMWRGPEKMSKTEFLRQVQEKSHVRNRTESEQLTNGVFKALKKQLPDKAIENVATQLPKDLKDMWRTS